MKSCELSVIKYLLFGFNLLFAVSGIGLILAGALILGDVEEFNHFTQGKILAPSIVLIVAGCIIFLVASLGCYGAIRESYYMLIAFALCLLVIFIIELAVGIAAAVYRNDLESGLRDVMKNSMENYNKSKSDKIAWDNLQEKLECCGVEGPVDWKSRPASCCHEPREGVPKPTAEQCRNALLTSDHLYQYGCLEGLQMKANSASKVLIGVGIGVAFIEIIGIFLACWLASAIKNRE